MWQASRVVGLELPYMHALLFGALISPTDPIAVLAILKDSGISRQTYTRIGAESLFLLGLEKRGLPVRQALRRIGDFIRMAETRSNSR